MRVISGKAKGLKLKSLSGLGTRPTADRIKESLFNIINPIIINAKVLDLFAGTGALGIEALSRGAETGDFIDENGESISIIKYNLEHTGFLNSAQVYRTDFKAGLKKLSKLNKKYDIVFIDPPYGKGFEYKAVELLVELELLKDTGTVIIETDKKNEPSDNLYGLNRVDIRSYGRTLMNFYKNSD